MKRVLVALAVVTLLAVAGGAWHAQRAHLSAATAKARREALAAARTRVPDLLSYDRTSLDADLATALAQTTGRFTADYRRILSEVVQPTAKRRGISTRASVSAAGVVSGGRDRVVVLVSLTQTSSARGGKPSLSGSRVEVTLERVGTAWKVAGLKPV